MNAITGRHLIIDAYVEDGAVLENPTKICNLFDALVDALGMTYLQRPVATRVPVDPEKLETTDDEGGWSVICQITTSHIALHGWPLRKAVMMDVFSCHEFDVELAKELIWSHLRITESNVQNVARTDPRAAA
ncbi:MAG: S-adenosylmethionine decarboxylase [bacterium]